jgi:tRNA pseudouridine13 synthase
MLSHLTETQDDFVGAFKKLPVKLQALFVQAYQSYIFNRFLTARIKRDIPLNRAELGDWVLRVERSGLPLVSTAKIVTLGNSSEFGALLKDGKMRVALPIVGCSSRISQGETGDLEKQILDEEGVSLENFKIPGFHEMRARGGLRAINAPVKDFRLLGVSANEFSTKNEALMSFTLLRGCYATVLLREIIKPKDPVLSGF